MNGNIVIRQQSSFQNLYVTKLSNRPGKVEMSITAYYRLLPMQF